MYNCITGRKTTHSSGPWLTARAFASPPLQVLHRQAFEALSSGMLGACLALPRCKPAAVPILASWGARGQFTNTSAMATEFDAWARANPAMADRRDVHIGRYFGVLRRYRFLLAPHGQAIQSPKFLEAISVYTIPITRRSPAFEQLVECESRHEVGTRTACRLAESRLHIQYVCMHSLSGS